MSAHALSPADELADRVAIVTGGSRGIGAAIARRLAKAGAHIVIASRQVADGEAVARQIVAEGGRAVARTCDVAKADQVDRLVAAVSATHGRVDILVNNAGISPVHKEPQDLTETEWDAILAVNLKGAFLMSRAVAGSMMAQGHGVIINIASIAGTLPIPLESAYCASKAGLIGLTRSLAREWARYGIRVQAVAPGYVATEMNAAVRRDAAAYAEYVGSAGTSDATAPAALRMAGRTYGAVVGRTPLGRYGLPEEVAEVVCFLASDRASYMTGSVTYVDGGWVVGEPPAIWPMPDELGSP